MTKHTRQVIREAIAERLKTEISEDVKKIFTTRLKPLFDQNLPAVLVYSNSERIEEDNFDIDGFGASKRNLELGIEVVNTASEKLDDFLDDIALKVEKALLNGWEIPQQKNAVIRLKNTDMDYSIDGSSVYGAVRIIFEIIYYMKGFEDVD